MSSKLSTIKNQPKRTLKPFKQQHHQQQQQQQRKLTTLANNNKKTKNKKVPLKLIRRTNGSSPQQDPQPRASIQEFRDSLKQGLESMTPEKWSQASDFRDENGNSLDTFLHKLANAPQGSSEQLQHLSNPIFEKPLSANIFKQTNYLTKEHMNDIYEYQDQLNGNTQHKLTLDEAKQQLKDKHARGELKKIQYDPGQDDGFHPLEQFLKPSIHSLPNQPSKFGLSGHTIRVKKLYRKLLRDQFSHSGLRWEEWVHAAQDLRNEFEKYRTLTDIGEIETLIKEAEVYLYTTEDSSPYRPLFHPQGLLWGRNEAPSRELLKPPPSQFVLGRDYHVEERIIRHIHAHPDDVDYAPTNDAYAIMKIKRGEYWFDVTNPATINHVVQSYCDQVGIKYAPDVEEMEQIAQFGSSNNEETVNDRHGI